MNSCQFVTNSTDTAEADLQLTKTTRLTQSITLSKEAICNSDWVVVVEEQSIGKKRKRPATSDSSESFSFGGSEKRQKIGVN